MKTLWIIIVSVGFSLVVSIPALSQNTDKKQTEDIVAIQQVRAELDSAWNRHDAAALGELFLDNADFQWHTGELLKNRIEIEKYFGETVFKNIPAVYHHNTTFQRIRFLDTDIAIGDGTIIVSREGAPENEQPFLSVLFTCVGKKEKGKWYIAAARLMQVNREQ
ncbi:MAG: SgcJ/EcaC family oxidoreductase [Bacteroidota bacterium]